jgi:hypothetical protein
VKLSIWGILKISAAVIILSIFFLIKKVKYGIHAKLRFKMLVDQDFGEFDPTAKMIHIYILAIYVRSEGFSVFIINSLCVLSHEIGHTLDPDEKGRTEYIKQIWYESKELGTMNKVEFDCLLAQYHYESELKALEYGTLIIPKRIESEFIKMNQINLDTRMKHLAQAKLRREFA